MMAAHAVTQCGLTPVIYDMDPDKTRRNAGVYVLHSPCDLNLEPIMVMQQVLGVGEYPGGLDFEEWVNAAYTHKVYGCEYLPESTSVLKAMRDPTLVVYNAEEAIEQLWDLYGGQVHQMSIEHMGDVLWLKIQHRRVVSTIPAPRLFPHVVDYYSSKAYVIRTSLGLGLGASSIVYNVGASPGWYRFSEVFGTSTWEYAYRPTCAGVIPVRKVVGTSVPLPSHNSWLILAGRYGAWDKSCLTDTVYQRVKDEVKSRWT